MEEAGQKIELGDLQILWDSYLERLSEMYGRIQIDLAGGALGERLVIGFEGAGC